MEIVFCPPVLSRLSICIDHPNRMSIVLWFSVLLQRRPQVLPRRHVDPPSSALETVRGGQKFIFHSRPVLSKRLAHGSHLTFNFFTTAKATERQLKKDNVVEIQERPPGSGGKVEGVSAGEER